MRYKIIRFVSGLMFFSFFILIALLATELLSGLHLHYIVPRINPYFAEEGNTRQDMDEPPLPRVSLSENSISIQSRLEKAVASTWEIPSDHETDAERTSRYALFPGLDDASRLRFAISHAESVLVFDAQDKLTRVYSDWLKQNQLTESIERWLPIEQLQSAVRRARLQKILYSADLPMNGGSKPDARVEGSFFFFPETGEVFAYLPLELAALKSRVQSLPGDSRWEVYGLRYKPNLRDVPHTVSFSSNAFGFRAPDVAVAKPIDTFRILCIGGSTTHEGADNESTYPALLEQRLRSRFPGKRIEVLNCGIEGILTRSQFLRVPDYLALQADLVIA